MKYTKYLIENDFFQYDQNNLPTNKILKYITKFIMFLVILNYFLMCSSLLVITIPTDLSRNQLYSGIKFYRKYCR